MMNYRISKYNPKYRDEHGIYTRDEWTSISDVGEYFNGYEVTMEEYLETENRYVKAIDIILDYLKISYLYIMELEKYENDITNTSNDFYINIISPKLPDVIINKINELGLYID